MLVSWKHTRYNILLRQAQENVCLRRRPMRKRPWSLRRSTIETSDARLRWDRAYQSLVQWSATARQENPPSPLAKVCRDESRYVCAGVYPTSGLDANDRAATPDLVRV